MPTAITTGQAQAPDGSLVPLVCFSTPLGDQTYWLTPELAQALGDELLAMASAARSNLVVPNGHGDLKAVPEG